MTDERMRQLRALVEAATPGPWRYDGVDVHQLTDGGQGYPLNVYPDSKDIVVGKCPECGELAGVGPQRRDDAAFIAESRTAVVELLDEVERLRAALTAIANHPHQSYEHDGPARSDSDRQYQIGVADGHRCAGNEARLALAAVGGGR